MSAEQDVESRKANVVWFDGDVADGNGQPISMYSIVTPKVGITQFYAIDEEPMRIGCGVRCLVLGAADGDRDWLWLEVDEIGELADAHVVIHRTRVTKLPVA